GDRGAASGRAVNRERPAEKPGEALGDVEPQPYTAVATRLGAVRLAEFIENEREFFLRYADSRIEDLEFHPSADNSRRQRNPPVLCEFNAVVQETLQNPANLVRIGSDDGQIGRVIPLERNRLTPRRVISPPLLLPNSAE